MDQKLQAGLGIAALVAAAYAALAQGSAEPEAAAEKNPVTSNIVRLAAVAPSARDKIDYAALDQRLQRMVERPNMVGMAVGIVENGRITFLRGYGETVEGSGDPVTPETVFRWASVSKGVAGTMVGKLAEEGKLDWNAPINRYSRTLKLPGGLEHQATLGDVLSHRLGLYRNAYDDKLESGESPAAIRMSYASLASLCAPGTCWSYQNIAYDASSEAVAVATGKLYSDAVVEQLFRPLGMTSASVTREGIERAKSWARPHSVGRRELEMSDAYYRVPAAGGVNSNIKDLALWMIAQMGGMPDVLSPALLAKIHAPLVETPNERGRLRKFRERLDNPHYGYGWRSYDYAGHRIIGHRGGVNGYRSLILFDPKLKSGVVALWNSSTSQPGGLEFEVMDMIYRLEFRDWMELDKGRPVNVAESADDNNSGSGDGPSR